MKNIFIVLCVVGIMFLVSNNISVSMPCSQITPEEQLITEIISQVSEQEIHQTVSDLVNFVTRVYGTSGNTAASTYLYNRLASIPGLNVEYQGGDLRNVIATLPGLDASSSEIYIVGAHYDSYSSDPNNSPGATDDASGVALVLEFARIMSRYRFSHTIKFACWNGEESGLLGSWNYAAYASSSGLNIPLYVNLDSSSYDPYGRFILDIMYDGQSQWAADMLTEHNALYGIGFTLAYNAHTCSSDYKSFRYYGYAAVMTHSETHASNGIYDTVDKVSTLYAKKNGQLCMSILARVAQPHANGYLRVTTSPPLPSTILVDGVPRNDWGLDWMKITPGTYTVSFTDMPGYETPEPQIIIVNAGQTTTVTGTYSQQGYLRINTDPALPATVYLDGHPLNDWGAWLPLTPGQYTVSFGAVEGYAIPANQLVTVNAGSTTVATGSYVSSGSTAPTGYGYLRVVTNPALPGTIIVDGLPRNDWGLDWVKMPPGTYTVSFTDVPGYQSPDAQTITVNESETTTVVGVFTQLGYLHVVTSPASQSTIYVDGYPMNDWGCWVTLPAGSYEVSWGPIPGDGGGIPPPQVVSVSAGSTIAVTGVFP